MGYKCVFQVKRRQMGPLIDLKLSLLLKGYTQLHMLDYKKTFSTVVKQATIRTVLTTAVMKRWLLR